MSRHFSLIMILIALSTKQHISHCHTVLFQTLKEQGYEFDIAFTSVLKRAIKTLYLLQEELDCHWLPVVRSWRLNERHYGALQGYNKSETAKTYGEDQVKVRFNNVNFIFSYVLEL